MQRSIDIFDQDLLTARRDRLASSAHNHDFLLHEVAGDLVDRLRLVKRDFRRVLDLGCHHGVLGRAIAQAVPQSCVVGIDGSERLAALAPGLKVCGRLDTLPFADASFDLVASGLALHMVNDLPRALAEARRVLKPDGLFLGSILGGRTLHELRTAFLVAEEELEGGASLRVAPGIDLGELSLLFARAQFALAVADTHELVVTFPASHALVRELKAMGASNALIGRRRKPIRRTTFERALAVYAERSGSSDGRINATFEIMTLTGWAAHPSQPKPLQPGSATHRLADALKTSAKP